jgi:hypothetical protein
MNKQTTFALTLAALVGAMAAAPVMADHNSPMGAGWASMPNDIHNTRFDTMLTDDSEAFLDFVRYGAGADSVNRYLTDTPAVTRSPVSPVAAPLTTPGIPSMQGGPRR